MTYQGHEALAAKILVWGIVFGLVFSLWRQTFWEAGTPYPIETCAGLKLVLEDETHEDYQVAKDGWRSGCRGVYEDWEYE